MPKFSAICLPTHFFFRPKDATHYNLVGLLPFTAYKAFLKPCHSKEPISDVLDFLTKQDGKY